jgi:speckle-type POZ protein
MSKSKYSSSYQKDEILVKSFEVQWKIPEFGDRRDKASGQCIKSRDLLITNDRESKIYLYFTIYPEGDYSSNNHPDDEGKWISLYAKIKSEVFYEPTFHLELSILDENGEKFISNFFHQKLPFGNSRGYSKFIRQADLDNPVNNLLPDDTLTIYCRIQETTGGSGPCTCPAENPQIIHSRTKMAADFASFLENKTNTDIVFSIGNERIAAHKTILAARSPVFAAMFEHDMREKKNSQVDVADITPNAFKRLLHFIYTGECEVRSLTEEIFFAADKYDVKDLKQICQIEMRKKLDVDNAIRLLILSDLHQAYDLKEKAILFINENAASVMKRPEWKELIKSHAHLIAELYSQMVDVEMEED